MVQNKKSDVYLFWEKRINVNAKLPIDLKTEKEIKTSDFAVFESHKINLKYPYKPFLILAILDEFKSYSFKMEINLETSNIIKKFYDFCTFDKLLFDILKAQKLKNKWFLGFNDELKKSILSIIKEGPLSHLQSSSNHHKQWFIWNRQKNTIFLNIDSSNPKDDTNELKNLTFSTLKKCIFWFQKYEKYEEFSSAPELLKLNDIIIENNKYGKNLIREKQHLFRKDVLDRDKKCIICCTENNSLLQACHIKPFSKCNGLEKYDESNGITLCLNHHKLLDDGYFTLNKECKVVLSKKIKNDCRDFNLFFKQFEPCFFKTIRKFPDSTFSNNYWKYHNKYIFPKN